MRRWRSSLLLVALAGSALAQTASQRQGVDVLRVGHRIACRCGCPDTVATCSMLECSFCVPAKQKIFNMQRAGVSDREIIDSFIKEYGTQVYRGEPNSLGWAIPYVVLALGVLVIVWFVRRYYQPRPAAGTGPPLEDQDLGRYREQIEKDLAQLD